MTENTYARVKTYMKKYEMIEAHDLVVAGVSGGADSVCMLELLSAYAERVALKLYVVHVNHGLRKEAREDAGYVEELCRQKGLPFFLTEADAGQTAAVEKCS